MLLFFFALESDEDVYDKSENEVSVSRFTSECAFLHFLNYPLIVLVDCRLIESLYSLVLSVEYFQGSKFTAQKLL